MYFNYNNPVHIHFGENCIRQDAEDLIGQGTRALIVTGKSSEKNGCLDDICDVLEDHSIPYTVFNDIIPNPTVASVRRGTQFAKDFGADFIIAAGGGSPMDTAKGIALLARQDLSNDQLFHSEYYTQDVLPTVMVPTTAGTGSEVSEYAVLMDEEAQTKSSISTPLIYPKAAYLDYRYTRTLGRNSTVYPALDALSHSIEGILSQRGDAMITAIAMESIRSISQCFPAMETMELADSHRELLLYGACLGGLVLAHTSTTVVHAMGHSLTFSKGIVHGRANALCLPGYLRFTAGARPDLVSKILHNMGLESLDEMDDVFNRFLGKKEVLTEEEILEFTRIVSHKRNVPNCLVVPTPRDIEIMFRNL
ncbi:MAG: iron-containing alcohol dehydrogenase family protein [Clostridiales bacterium]|nr:iron-containing alcohol dehydrogenase family protein [Clostridiales bacterium]